MGYTKVNFVDGTNQYDIKTSAGVTLYSNVQFVYSGTAGGTALSSTNFNIMEDGIYKAAPTGAMMDCPTSTPPSGWLERDGSALSRTTYADLFAVIGTNYGSTAADTFNLPDDRGYFSRWWDHGRGIDSGRTIGSYQADDNKLHTHSGTVSISNDVGTEGSFIGYAAASGSQGIATMSPSHSLSVDNTGATEVTVKNRAYMPIIRY